MNYRSRCDLEFFRLEQSDSLLLQWVVRDPLNRQCYYLGEEEYFLLRKLDGHHSFSSLKKQFETEFSPRQLAAAEFQNLIADWSLKGLLICDPLLLKKIQESSGIQRSHRTRSRFLMQLANPLVIRFRGWNPQRFLEKLTSVTGWIFSWNFTIISMLIFLFAVSITFSRLDQIVFEIAQLPLLFQPRHWLFILVLLGLTKVVHEFGHAIACHRYGGKCHEMGVMFLAFMPCLYCNVTDAWTFPRRGQRLVVSAAGIYADLWIAGACLILWSISQPGFLHSACLLLAVFGSVNSVLLNGNPLMRYDGYYIVSDLFGIPNMRTESQKQARQGFWTVLFGEKKLKSREPFSASLATYGIASGIYLWVVIVLILSGLHFMLKPFHLEFLVLILGILIVPAQLYATWKHLYGEGKREFRLRGSSKIRAFITAGVMTGLLFALVLIPFPRRVPATGVLRPVSKQAVVVVNPGTVLNAPHTGHQIDAGTTILQLQDAQLDQTLLSMQTNNDALGERARAIQKKRTLFSNSSETLSLLKKIRESTQKEQAHFEEQKHSLKLVSKVAGHLIPDPELYTEPFLGNNNAPDKTSGVFYLKKENRGAYVPQGTRIAVIAEPNVIEVLLAIEDHWARQVQIGADVLLFSPERPGNPLTGKLQAISDSMHSEASESQKLPEEKQLLQYLNQQPGNHKNKHFFAVVRIEQQQNPPLSYYQLCNARVQTANASLYSRITDYLSRTLIRF